MDQAKKVLGGLLGGGGNLADLLLEIALLIKGLSTPGMNVPIKTRFKAFGKRFRLEGTITREP